MTRSSLLAAAGLAALGAVAAAPAQNRAVIPPAQTNADGNSLDQEPVGRDRIRHVQYVHRSYLTRIPARAQLRTLAYRRDATAARNATLKRVARNQKRKPLWSLRLGNRPLSFDVLRPPPVYPVSGMTTVLNGKAIDFPDLPPPPAAGPAPWAIVFTFDRPFSYAGGHLVVDNFAYMTPNRNYNYWIDAVQGSPGAGGKVARTAPGAVGCPPGQNRARGLAPNPGAGDLEFYLFGAPTTSSAFACLGASDRSWAGLSLPLDLGPVLGLNGCKVYNDFLTHVSTRTTTAGTAEWRAPVPAEADLLGATMFGQWVVVDPRVNPVVDLATSEGLRFTLGTRLRGVLFNMSVVSASAAQARGRAGFVQPNRGAVFRVTW